MSPPGNIEFYLDLDNKVVIVGEETHPIRMLDEFGDVVSDIEDAAIVEFDLDGDTVAYIDLRDLDEHVLDTATLH
jgi:hypothetical protein